MAENVEQSRDGVRVEAVVKIALTVILTGLVVFGALWLVWSLSQIIRWIVIALFFTIALTPAVDWLHRRRVPRALAILLLFAALILVFAGLGALIVPPLVSQVGQLTKFVQQAISHPQGISEAVQNFASQYGLGGLVDKLRSQASSLPSKLTGAVGPLLTVTKGLVSSITAFVSILLLTFFLLLDGHRFLRAGLSILSERRRPGIERVLRQSGEAVNNYIVGNLTISVIAGIASFIMMEIVRMPYTVALALIVAIFDLIPLVGASLGAIIVTIVGLVVSPLTGVILLVYFIVYQQVENNIIQPYIYGRSINLHPLSVFIAALAGAQLLGVLGTLLAIPVAEIIRILAIELLRWRGVIKPEPAAAPQASEETPS